MSATMGTEVEHGRKITVFSDKLRNLLLGFIKDLSHRKGIVRAETTIPHFPKEFSDSLRLINHIGTGGHTVLSVCRIVMSLKGEYLLDIQDGINTETGYPLVQPPINHLVDFFSKLWILPV